MNDLPIDWAKFWTPSIDLMRRLNVKVLEAPFFGNRFMDDGEGPRCSGRASPEVIDYCCLSDNDEHEWKTIRDFETGERDSFCNKCGREWCERDWWRSI